MLIPMRPLIALMPLRGGESWTYRNTVEKGANNWHETHEVLTVERATGSSIYFNRRQSDSPQAPTEVVAARDWSRVRDVNGKETAVNRPLSFPLEIGKHWSLDYTEAHPNKAHDSEHWERTYTVVGYEAVTVPAGQFNALKIEAEGHWMATLAPGTTVVQAAQSRNGEVDTASSVQRNAGGSATGRTYMAIWYVPEVKRWVKSVEEYYTPGGVRNERYVSELESFEVARPAAP